MEEKELKMYINGLCNSIIMIANKFIKKVETGRARSKETFNDFLLLKSEAEMLKNIVNKPDIIMEDVQEQNIETLKVIPK